MVEESGHGVDALLAGRTAWYNDTMPALRYGRRLIYKMAEVVSADFLL